MKDPLPPMSKKQKVLMFVLFACTLCMLLPSILPKTLFGIAFLNKIGPVGVTLFFIIGLCVFEIDEKPIFNFKEIAATSIIWDVYLLVCSAMAISAALTAPNMGITEFLAETLDPILGGHSSTMFLIILLSVSLGITQFANNGVMGVLLMPVVGIFSVQSGVSFEGAATLMVLLLHIALLTPASSPYAAVLFGNTEWVDKKDILKYAILIVLLTLFTFLVLGPPLLNLLY